MKPYLFVLLPLLAVASSHADVPRDSVDATIVRTRDVACLPEETALQRQGRRARYRIELDSSEWEQGRYVAYDCRTDDMTHKTVWLVPGEEATDEMEVEARLVILRHRGWIAQDGTRFEAFTEWRLMDARRCR
jgi:hypothetical protein